MRSKLGAGRAILCAGVAMLFVCRLPVSGLAAEKASLVTVEARVLKDKVKIGDEIRLLLKVEHPRTFTLEALDPKMPVSPFEIKRLEPIPVRRGQNRVEETFRMTLLVFGTGQLQVPPIPVRYTDASGKPGQVSSEPVKVTVLSVGKKITDKDDIRPIKGPAASDLTRFWTGIGALLAGALAVFLLVRLILRFVRSRENAESRKPAPVRARIELERLKDRGLLEEKNYREYYAGLSDILRRYLERRFGFKALDETSAEILKSLERPDVPGEARRDAARILKDCDLVKFAKTVPSYELAGELESLIFGVIEATPPPPKVKK